MISSIIGERSREAMQSYLEKNQWLSENFVEVAPRDFYRAIFPEGSFERVGEFDEHKPNGIAMDLSEKPKALSWVVTDDHDKFIELQDSSFAITSPISYFGKTRAGRNARFLHAMAFDIDGVELANLKDLIHQMKSERWYPMANFICNSGHGVHVYYVFDEPIPLYPQNQEYLKLLKYALTGKLWNAYTSTIKEPQMQGILQGFRIVGSQTKFGAGFPVKAFRLREEPVSLQRLVDCVTQFDEEYQALRALETKKNSMTLEEARKKYPEWYDRRIEQGQGVKKWCLNRAVYEYWKNRIYMEIKVGHRYFAIMTLAIYAKKCSGYDPKKNPNPVTEEELRRDAYALLEPFERLTENEENHFDEQDIEDALELFNEDYMTFPKRDIEKVTALRIEPQNRRNGRAQKQHLGRIRAMQQFDDPEGEWRNRDGRPKGSGTAEAKVRAWREAHPDGTKSQCKNDTGLTYNTIRKWWGE